MLGPNDVDRWSAAWWNGMAPSCPRKTSPGFHPAEVVFKADSEPATPEWQDTAVELTRQVDSGGPGFWLGLNQLSFVGSELLING